MSKKIVTEWTVTGQGFVESASVTWTDSESLDRVRVTELLPKGKLDERDELLVKLLQQGRARCGGSQRAGT